MKHDFMKDRDCLINFMIITSSCKKTLEELVHIDRTDSIYDIVLTVDGVEMDLEKFMSRWEDNVERMLEEKAKELVQKNFDPINEGMNEVYDSVNELQKVIDKIIKEKMKILENKNG